MGRLNPLDISPDMLPLLRVEVHTFSGWMRFTLDPFATEAEAEVAALLESLKHYPEEYAEAVHVLRLRESCKPVMVTDEPRDAFTDGVVIGIFAIVFIAVCAWGWVLLWRTP